MILTNWLQQQKQFAGIKKTDRGIVTCVIDEKLIFKLSGIFVIKLVICPPKYNFA